MSCSACRPFDVGDILISSWGVPQTIVDFCQVTHASPKTVGIRRIDARNVKIVSPNEAIIQAVRGAFRDEEQRRRPRREAEEWAGDVESWERATRWDGSPMQTVRYV